MALNPQTLSPTLPMPPSVEFGSRDSRTYDVRQWDWATVQITPGSGDAFPAATITVDASDVNGQFDNFPAATVTFAAYGISERLLVKGLGSLRVRTSSPAAATTATYRVRVRGSSDG